MQRSDFDTAHDYAEWARRSGLDYVDRQGRPRGCGGASGSLALACVPVRKPKPLRQSRYLTGGEFWKTYRGVALANLNGEVLASMLTISWGSVDLSGAAAWAAHRRFIELFRKWRQARGMSQSWFWVRERGSKLGDHSHIVMQLDWEFELELHRWAERAFETVTEQPALRASRSRLLQTAHLRSQRMRIEDQVARQWAFFQYLFKGLPMDEAVAVPGLIRGSMPAANLISRPLRSQGLVIGKRSGLSKALGPSAVADFMAEYPLAFPARERLGEVAYGDRFLVCGETERRIQRLNI